MEATNEISKLKELRWEFLSYQIEKIKTAQNDKDVFLACKLFEEYAKYESNYSDKLRHLTHFEKGHR